MTHAQRARGFTMVELVAAMAILAMIMVVVAQTAHWSMLERGRTLARQAALETAANVLESARALPWDALTDKWAASQILPADHSSLPSGSILQVRVEPEKATPATKRVTVRVILPIHAGHPGSAIELVALFGARSVHPNGGEK